MKKLIINADGFGFTFGNNRAIFEVAKFGSISSISVNTNFPAIEELPSFYNQFPHISVGVHLNPIVGPPILDSKKVLSLLGPDGEFWGKQFSSRLRKGHIKLGELFEELKAQVNVVLNMGIPVTHLDSHQNQHLRPKYYAVFIKVAKATGIKHMRTHRHFICAECKHRKKQAVKFYTTHIKTAMLHLYTRWLMHCAKQAGIKMADRLLSIGHTTRETKGSLKVWENIISNVPGGINEVYCHPGYPDETLQQYADYVDGRKQECAVLLSSQFKKLLIDNEVNLIGFKNI